MGSNLHRIFMWVVTLEGFTLCRRAVQRPHTANNSKQPGRFSLLSRKMTTKIQYNTIKENKDFDLQNIPPTHPLWWCLCLCLTYWAQFCWSIQHSMLALDCVWSHKIISAVKLRNLIKFVNYVKPHADKILILKPFPYEAWAESELPLCFFLSIIEMSCTFDGDA